MKTFTSFIRNGFSLTLLLLLVTNAGVTRTVIPADKETEGAAMEYYAGSSAFMYSMAPQLCSSAAVAVADFYDPDGNMNQENAVGEPDEDYAAIGKSEFIMLDLTGEGLPAGSTATINWRKESDQYSPFVYICLVSESGEWTLLDPLQVTNLEFSGYAVDLSAGTRYLYITNTSDHWLFVESVTTIYPCPECTDGTLTLDTGDSEQSVCQDAEINNIVYTVGGGATGAEVTGLPDGVTGNYDSGIFTISGTPTVSGTFGYTVTTTGTESPCIEATATGTITVTAPPTAPGINVQNNCGNSTLTATGYTGTLLWSTGETTAVITVTSDGTYTVTQTVGECTSVPGETTVTILSSPVATPPELGDGSSGNPYRIATLENLYWIAANSGVWDKHFIQTADIAASATAGWCTGGWLPIGNFWVNDNTGIRVFSGSYDGQGHTISGLYIANSTSVAFGLFGRAVGATIKNLGLINVVVFDVLGDAGALVGSAKGCSIDNCYSTGSIAVSFEGILYNAGGLVGSQETNSVMSNCNSTCNVAGDGRIGGLVGWNTNYSSITNCFHAAGTVDGSASSMSSTGGLVGENNLYSSIEKCYSTGTVSGYDYIGGLVGANSKNASVSNCFSRCNVSGHSSFGYNGGGLVGYNYLNATINNCYSTGLVGELMGGLLGYQSDGATTINCFWDTETSGKISSFGGTGITTAEMKTQSTFVDWDFATIWGINAGNNDGYPYLVPASICINGTISLTSAPGSDNQTVCANTAITPIVYTISGGATGAGASGLPDGVTGNYDNGIFTISGTPAAAGSFNYTVTTTGTTSPCTEATATGTITVTAIPAAPFIIVQNHCGYTTLTATGYTGSLLWSTEETTASINVTTGGTYTVTQTVGGCTSTQGETTVVVEASPVATPPVLGDGSSGNPYRIATLENLYWITAGNNVVASPTQSQRFAAHYIQSADIDASATSEWCSGGWVPIGYLDTSYKEHPFSGTYDGGGFTISGLTINRPSEIWFQGLFGLVNGGTIKNLGLVNVDIIAGFNAGGLAGRVRFATVINCFTTGSVAGTATEYGYSNGGLVGNMMQSSLSECYSTCEVSGSTFVGGLIGHIELSIVTRCHSTGAVSHSSTRTGATTGGLVGWSAGTSFSTCYSTGNVFASGDASSGNNTGGFVGSNRNYYLSPHTPSSITDCYSTGNVSGSYNTGGFAGHNSSASGNLCTITNSYSRGEISGGGTLAGFVAENTGTISSCFFDADLDGISYTSSGTVNAGAIGKSSEEMKVQSTFVGWDFTTIWGLDAGNNDGYPYFLPASICIDGTIELALTSGPEIQTVCAGTAIADIVYAIGGGAMGASISPALPTGLSGAYDATSGTYSISGTPTDAGIYSYTVTTTGTTSPCEEATATGTITVNAQPYAAFDSPAPRPKCSGDDVSFYIKGTPGSRVTLQIGGSADNFIRDMDDSGRMEVTISSVTSNLTLYLVSVENQDGTCKVTLSESRSVDVYPVPVVSITGSNVIYVGETTTLSPQSGGSWTSSNNEVATVTNSGIVTGVAEGTAAFTFFSDITSCSATTEFITINEPACTNGSIVLTLGSDVQTVCANTAITNITYTIGGGATGASISPELPTGLSGAYDATSGTYSISGTPADAGVYSYTVTTTGTPSPCTEATAIGTITVLPQFTAGAIEIIGQILCYGDIPSEIGSTENASGGDDYITYKWQSSLLGNFTDAVDLEDSNVATWQPATGLSRTTYFRRLAKDGTCNTEFTASGGVFVVTVRPAFIAGTIVSSQETICYGGDVSKIGNSIDASGGDHDITYKWQSSILGDFTDAVDLEDSNSATYQPVGGFTQTTYFRRLAKDGTCNTEFTASYGLYIVIVRPQFTAGAIDTEGETICFNGDPGVIGSQTAASGGDNVVTYKWQANGLDIASSNVPTYDPPTGLTSTTIYTRWAKDGTCNEFTQSDGSWVVTVNALPVITPSVYSVTVQYSDPVDINISVTDDGSTTPLTVSTQFNKNGGVFVPGLPNGLSWLNPSAGTWNINGVADVAPGIYIIKIEADDGQCSSYVDLTLTVTQEDAITVYTGNEFVGEQNPNVSTTPLVLSATVTDMDDGYRGDIRNARVQFYDVNTLAPLSDWLTPGLVVPGGLTQGSVIHIWDAPVPASGYNTFTIGVKVGTQNPEDNGYYMGSDKAVVNVYRTDLYEFISGGGHIIPSMSKGEYASDPGRKVNFGFNVKWNKTMKRLQGNLNLVFRVGDKVYQVKANAMNSLSVNSVNPCSQQAYFTSKASLTDVTSPGLPVEIKGNLNLQVTMTNNTSPGAVCSIGFTVYDGNTLVYSSSWPGNQTEELPLAGGNIIVHNGITCVVNNKVDVMLSTSLNPSFVGQDVIFEAVVTPKGSTLVPEGTIVFKDGTAELGTVLLSNGKASLPVSNLSEGTHIVTAEFNSTNGFDDGLSNTISQEVKTQTVNSNISIALGSSRNPEQVRTTVTFTAIVTASGTPVALADVSFYINGTWLITVPTDGAGLAVIDYAFASTGTYLVEARFAGQSASLSQVIRNKVKPDKMDTGAELQFEMASMKAYPNPFVDHLKFEFTSPIPVHARIDIYDLTGRIIETVFDQQIEGGTVYHAEFKPEKEVSAMYLYRITLGNSSYVNKVVYKSGN